MIKLHIVVTIAHVERGNQVNDTELPAKGEVMRKGVPNLGALQAFEATARLGSFSRAAEELSLTHSAVFRQVSGLEERLGVALFTRVRRRIVLTDD